MKSMMERRTQAIMDRPDDLVPSCSQRRQSGVDSKEPSREATRETEANFGEPIAGKRTDAPVTGRGGSSQYTMGTVKPIHHGNRKRSQRGFVPTRTQHGQSANAKLPSNGTRQLFYRESFESAKTQSRES